MTQLEKSLEELDKDRSQFNGTAHVVRKDSTYFFICQRRRTLIRTTYHGAWSDSAIRSHFGTEMCDFALLSLFVLLPLKRLFFFKKKKKKKKKLKTPASLLFIPPSTEVPCHKLGSKEHFATLLGIEPYIHKIHH